MKKLGTYSIPFAAGMVALAGMGLAMAHGMPAAGEACVACHGKDGISKEADVPIIAGASEFFLENQLAMFAEQARPCVADYFAEEPEVSDEDHCASAEALSDDAKAELAAYFAAKPFKAAEQEIDSALADSGSSVHEANCARCHTEGGSLALDDSGILAGQWKAYLIKQFGHYMASERWKPERGISAFEGMGEEDLNALAEFYARKGL